jgi:hypothetical protein
MSFYPSSAAQPPRLALLARGDRSPATGPPGLPTHPSCAGASGPADRPACCARMLWLLRGDLRVAALPCPVQRRGRGVLGGTEGQCGPSGWAFCARAPVADIWGGLIPSVAHLSPRSVGGACPPPSPLTSPILRPGRTDYPGQLLNFSIIRLC